MASASIRPAAVAGMFYPGDRQQLQRQLTDLLSAPAPAPEPFAEAPPKALVVPHAGYVYSGPIAASAYRTLQPWRDRIHRVVLLGPAHRVAVRGAALPAAQTFDTPLGPVELDLDTWLTLQAVPGVTVSDLAHATEHALEVQLPFLMASLGHFRIVPLVVGYMPPEQVAGLLEAVWGGPETLIVISTDLSHYLRYEDARVVDRNTCDRVLALSGDIDPEEACGASPLNGFLLEARRHQLKPRLLDLRNSGDTSGQRGQVVGYASFTFDEDIDGARH
ncbi:MAG: AmmeMemoRadiSam system protein B [Rhodocyclaceae bacterium]|nr:AmmeMemoRadiSam system protein B [Rhodocyclaceae bacterium]